MDEVRAPTEAEAEAARAGGVAPWDYVRWIDAGFTPEEIDRWYPITRTREFGPGTAQRLRRAGVTPDGWRGTVDQVVHGRPYITAATSAEAADLAVLWDDVVRHLHACTATAVLRRNDAIAAATAFGYRPDLLTRRLHWPAGVLSRLSHRWRTPGH